MSLLPDWKRIVRKAWSLRLMLLAGWLSLARLARRRNKSS